MVHARGEAPEQEVLGRFGIELVQQSHRGPGALAEARPEAEVGKHRDADDRQVFGGVAELCLHVVTHGHPEGPRGLQAERDLVVGVRPSPVEHREVDLVSLQRFGSPHRHRLGTLRADETDLFLEVPHGEITNVGIVEHDRDRLVLEDVADERVAGREVEPDPPQRRGRCEAVHAGGEAEGRHHRGHREGEPDDRTANGRRAPSVSGFQRQPGPRDGRYRQAERGRGRGDPGMAITAGEFGRPQHRASVPGGPPRRDPDAGDHGDDDGHGADDEDAGLDEDTPAPPRRSGNPPAG